MNLLFDVLHGWKCKTASQKVALDALRHLGHERLPVEHAPRWRGLFLWHVEAYLRGVDAPETRFGDYANHVLYSADNWGGAARLARKWYWKTVETLRSGDWSEAAYDAGVLARYVAFPFSPWRTGHDEQALMLRRPGEWCVSQLYDELTGAAEGDANPPAAPHGDAWIERLVTEAAEESRRPLAKLTKGFDFDAVMRRPTALEAELKVILGRRLVRCSATIGTVLAHAVNEAAGNPPRYPLRVAGLCALPSLPLFWFTRSRAHSAERRAVRAMHREFRESGRIDATLPADARAVRDAYERDVLGKTPRKSETKTQASSIKAPPLPTAWQPVVPTRPALADQERSTPGSLRAASPVASLPPIGSKLAPRLHAAAVKTLADLLAADAEDLASALHPDATAVDVSDWQDQARLCCGVTLLTPDEARLLAACGVTGPEDLAALSPVELWELVVPVAESPDGRRLLHGGTPPDLDTVTRWIDASKRARKAA